jgi:glycosyltransferase involved in cell wall biosynthesis
VRYSVLIPAWRAERFLEECLRSVVAQSRFGTAGDYEVLVGVDGCEATLAKARAMRAEVPALRVLSSPTNLGPYIVRNTLAYAARGEFLIFFDADDVMLPGLVEWCEANREHLGLVQFRFVMVYGGARGRVPFPNGASGAFGIRRESFERLGGFKPWRCAADSDFRKRALRALGPAVLSPRPLFDYRKHAGSITSRPETAGNSRLRRVYHKMTSKEQAMRNGNLRVEPVFGRLEEVEG